MTSFDGKKQRNALTGAEQALRALADGNGDRAAKNAAKAADLDQIGIFVEFPEAVEAAVGDLVDGQVSEESWDRLSAVVGPGPLSFLIDEVRG